MTGCTSVEKINTLRGYDVKKSTPRKPKKVSIESKTTQQVKSAYQAYINSSNINSYSRMDALNRLAQIEFNLSEEYTEKQTLNTSSSIADNEKIKKSLDRTIKLLNVALNDYPDAKNNDKLLYQLSKACDQRGLYSASIDTLKILAKRYPKSRYYIEAQFRLGEHAFTHADYISAEDAYTEVLSSKNNITYLEKSIFKRAWSRFKQELYIDAIDDILRIIQFDNNSNYRLLTESQKLQFDEYYRIIGLSFVYSGGIQSLQSYLAGKNTIKNKFRLYLSLSDAYKRQHRYSEAVEVLKASMVSKEINASHHVNAYLEIISIWNKAGFNEKFNNSVNIFYKKFKLNNHYSASKNTIREYIYKLSTYYHSQYIKNGEITDFVRAELWYTRYIKEFNQFIRKNKIYYLYANLLESSGLYDKALKYYELSAYDSDIILNKSAAYATILATNKLFKAVKSDKKKKTRLLKKHIKYSILFSQLYSQDPRLINILIHAAELTYNMGRYSDTLRIYNNTPLHLAKENSFKIKYLAANAYFNLELYRHSENILIDILSTEEINKKDYLKVIKLAAASIYKQGEIENKHGNNDLSIYHYKRLHQSFPKTKASENGLYNAIYQLAQRLKWLEVISLIKTFRLSYPDSQYIPHVSKSLTIAYIKSNQSIKAAQEFEQLALIDKNTDVQKAALFQAAKLYEEKNVHISALRTYKTYINKYEKPYQQYMEALERLSLINKKYGNIKKHIYWSRYITEKDVKTPKSKKTSRTVFITANAYITLADDKKTLFDKQKLIRPLKKSLLKKKKTMQQAIYYYNKAAAKKITALTTKATYSIADIYFNFSQSLLNSQFPKNLNPKEKIQYKILLEDKAFPFEDKSIEFHEINMAKSSINVNNSWIKKSHNKLKELYPARYGRQNKVEGFLNAIH